MHKILLPLSVTGMLFACSGETEQLRLKVKLLEEKISLQQQMLEINKSMYNKSLSQALATKADDNAIAKVERLEEILLTGQQQIISQVQNSIMEELSKQPPPSDNANANQSALDEIEKLGKMVSELRNQLNETNDKMTNSATSFEAFDAVNEADLDVVIQSQDFSQIDEIEAVQGQNGNGDDGMEQMVVLGAAMAACAVATAGTCAMIAAIVPAMFGTDYTSQEIQTMGTAMEGMANGRALTPSEIDVLSKVGKNHLNLNPEDVKLLNLALNKPDDALAQIIKKAVAQEVGVSEQALTDIHQLLTNNTSDCVVLKNRLRNFAPEPESRASRTILTLYRDSMRSKTELKSCYSQVEQALSNT